MITDDQRTRLHAALAHQPTNPPSPHFTIAELDELRSLAEAGRETDAWAMLVAKGNAANQHSWQATMERSQEMYRETERARMEQREHAARMAALPKTMATSEQVKVAPSSITHRVKKRAHPLDSVIEAAKAKVEDPLDYQAVWTALITLAESNERKPPLLGFAFGEGIKYMGKNYEKEGTPDFFTKAALKKRWDRAAMNSPLAPDKAR